MLKISDEVARTLRLGGPVVALESTIITHGMEYPQNKDTALAVERIIREAGATPATIAILKGVVRVGLSEEEIDHLARNKKDARKCSRRDLGAVLTLKQNGSTTVAGTMFLAQMAGIHVFVTGGIGGVHRMAPKRTLLRSPDEDAELTFDISADLTELARTRVAVVCAGAKSILDIANTLEFLETMGVPVIAHNSDFFPDFYTPSSGLRAPLRANSPSDCAQIYKTMLDLNQQNGMLVAVPVPAEQAAPEEAVKSAISTALREADEQKISGAAITPFLLRRVNELTGGDSSASNVALIKNNARYGAQMAIALAAEIKSEKRQPVGSRPPKVVLVGGISADLRTTAGEVTANDNSSRGQVEIYAGGAARNATECLSRLGLRGDEALLLSTVGSDQLGSFLLGSLEKLGLSRRGVMTLEGMKSGVFSAQLDR